MITYLFRRESHSSYVMFLKLLCRACNLYSYSKLHHAIRLKHSYLFLYKLYPIKHGGLCELFCCCSFKLNLMLKYSITPSSKWVIIWKYNIFLLIYYWSRTTILCGSWRSVTDLCIYSLVLLKLFTTPHSFIVCIV